LAEADRQLPEAGTDRLAGVSVLIADDHPLVRRGIRALLESSTACEVCAEAGNGRDAVAAARALKPQCVIMDPGMPGLNGADATVQIRREHPETVVVALSMHSDAQHVGAMLHAGASAYLLKTCEAKELLHAIEVALDGGTYLTPTVASEVVDGYVHGRDRSAWAGLSLSAREREVLQLIAEGNSTKQIGRVLHVSPRTIDSHRQRLMAKMNVDSVAGLTKQAIRLGLTTVED